MLLISTNKFLIRLPSLNRNDNCQNQRDERAVELGGISSRESSVPHFSAFRPVSSVASSSTSKFLSNTISSDIYGQRNPGKDSPESSAIESSCSIVKQVYIFLRLKSIVTLLKIN